MPLIPALETMKQELSFRLESEDSWRQDQPFQSEVEVTASDWPFCISDLQL